MGVGYPKEISVGFAGIPNDVDTAFVWSGNGKTYFFKGNNLINKNEHGTNCVCLHR